MHSPSKWVDLQIKKFVEMLMNANEKFEMLKGDKNLHTPFYAYLSQLKADPDKFAIFFLTPSVH